MIAPRFIVFNRVVGRNELPVAAYCIIHSGNVLDCAEQSNSKSGYYPSSLVVLMNAGYFAEVRIAMSSIPNVYISPEEYLALERQAEHKSEYIDGEIFAMAGGSERHNLIVANIIAGLHSQLPGSSCRVYPSDLKVRAQKPRYFFYPDVSVVCGETKFHDAERDVVLNPVVIFEVLSEATAAYDRGRKFQDYQQLDTLDEYVLVSQNEALIEHYVRQENDSWIYTKLSGLDASLVLPSIKCQLELSFIYHNAN